MRFSAFFSVCSPLRRSCRVCLPRRRGILVNIDKTTQSMTVTVDGAPRYIWPVSTGKRLRHAERTFRPNRMDADHLSQEWDNAPMPHTIFFDLHGHAIHGFIDTRRIGSPASHGCVRLAPENAAALYALVETQGMKDTTVIVSGRTPTGAEMARRGGRPSRPPPVPCRSRPATAQPARATSSRPCLTDNSSPPRRRCLANRCSAARSKLQLRPTTAAADRVFWTAAAAAAYGQQPVLCTIFKRPALLRAAGLPATILPAILRDAAGHHFRLLKLEHEIVDRHGRLEGDEVARVLRVAPEIAFGHEPKAGRLDFLAQRAFLDAMQRLADRGAVTVLGEMIGDHQNAAGLQRANILRSISARSTGMYVVSW